MRKQKILLIAILVLVFLFSASQTLAALVPCGGEGQPDCQFCHLFLLITNILNFTLTRLVPIVGALMLIIGGLYLLTAGASPETFSKAKSVITAAIIGLAIIFLAWVFLNQLLVFMEYQEWTGLGGWWEFTDKCPIR